jgi:hypothetical protein
MLPTVAAQNGTDVTLILILVAAALFAYFWFLISLFSPFVPLQKGLAS